ncbi:LysR family transcriptional regulator [Lujinxingia vulgaris]|uniref:LysR family transcriptional regulator n=2 Tax=Lujinxingia vulgaris TaxID=2600176 RepID=A0A5C6XB07_9DELT|nr:LysR family transcriptional regulator [Lujinxingia vulgaris]
MPHTPFCTRRPFNLRRTMELSHLRTFLMLANEGHMTRAAARLHLTQPAVSAQLARLEESLGQRLFDRTSSGLVLTQSGQTFLPYAQEALSRLEDARSALDQLSGLQRGALSIGGGATATTFLLPPLLARFHEANPAIRFFVREQPSQSVVEDVLSGVLDLGVVTLPVRQPSGDSGAGKLHVEQWIDDELRLLVPPRFELSHQRDFGWEDLAGVPLVLFEAGSAVRNLIDARILEAGVDADIVMELRSIESLKQMVAQGIGAAFVSQHALTGSEHGLMARANPLRRTLAVCYRSDRTLPAAAQAFLDLMRQSSLLARSEHTASGPQGSTSG